MLSENDKQILLRNLNRNEVVLVLGAGFSVDCLNRFNEPLPTSWKLAAKLWPFLYEPEPYDNSTQLKTLYGAALNHRKGRHALRGFLRDHLYATVIPDWYQLIPKRFWFRIYSFNADNVIEKLYPEASIDRIIAPAPYSERDSLLRSTQYIKLHGSLDDNGELTFGAKEYAVRANAPFDLWYQHFVEDYSTKSVIFVGTELDEQLFFQYIEARGKQLGDSDDVRLPKCFLVKPTISKPLEDQLKPYRIVPVRSTAKVFFEWLHSQQPPLSREEILRITNRNLEPALEASEQSAPTKTVKELEAFLSAFHAVKRPSLPRVYSNNLFLLGSPPTWLDIAHNLDADREVNSVFHELLEEAFKLSNIDVIRVSAPAGGGKSTVMRRAALSLVDDGYKVFFSNSSEPADADVIVNYTLSMKERMYLFFDNAGSDITEIARAWERLKGFEFRPVFVVAARTNDFAYNGYEFEKRGARSKDLVVPDMTDSDIKAVIAVLDRQDLLGKLKPKSSEDRFQAFKEKALQQILIAMREATSGDGFNQILRDEFAKLNTDDAKLLYLIAAIASDDDFGLTKEFMIGAMADTPVKILSLIEKALSGILIPREGVEETYSIRHPAIGHFIVDSANREKLAEAMIALMTALWGVMPDGRAKKKSRAFTTFRRLINHTYIQGKFPRKETARGIYESIKPYFRDDGHFWLQYASYEIESGADLALAENYLDQAEGLLGEGSQQVQTAKAHLLFLKSLASQNAAVAEELADDALAILRRHMAQPTTVSWHALHIFGDQMRAYIWQWVPTMERSGRFAKAHEELRRAIPENMQSHRLLRSTLESLKRAQLETIVKPR